MRTLPCGYRQVLLLLLLLCVGSLVIAQEAAPDKALLAKAQQAMADGKWDDAVTTLEALRKQYPNSPELPDGTVLLYQAYLNVPSPEKATAVGREIVTRWPKTGYVWQMVLITAKQKAKKSATDAVATLDLALKQGILSTEDRTKAENQRVTFLKKAQSEQYQNELLASIEALKWPVTQEALLSAADQAKTLYPLLITAGRFEEAKAIGVKMQELLTKAGNPHGRLQTDLQAYLDALKAADAKRYAEEVTLIIKQIGLAKTAGEVDYTARLAIALYEGMLKNAPYAEVKPLHEGVQQALQQQQLSARLKEEGKAWLTAVNKVYPEQIVLEMLKKIKQLANAKSADEVAFPIELMVEVYKTCYAQKQPEIAKTLHGQLQTALKKFDLKDDISTDNIQYEIQRLLYLRDANRQQYLTELSPVLSDLVDHCPKMAQVNLIWALVYQPGTYADLFGARMTKEALQLDQHLRTELRKYGEANLYQIWTHDLVFYSAFGAGDSKAFLPFYLARVAEVEKLCPYADFMAFCATSLHAYNALMRAGRLTEAKELHQRFQVMAKQQKTPESSIGQESHHYYTALAMSAKDTFMAEIKPVLEKMAKAKTVEEMLECAPQVQMIYLGLNETGGFKEALAAHEQLQALYTKFNRKEEADRDNKIFSANTDWGAWQGMLAEFNKALTAKDTVAAKRWLKVLTDVAPTSYQATQAKKLWNEAGLEK